MYLPHIDGLRAIAILSVLLYHLNKAWFPGGFLGVDIFFVISGFIVSASLNDLQAMSLPRFITHFYSKRLVRIIPALLVCLFVSAFATALFIPEAYLSVNIWKTCQFAFLGLSNFILAQPVNDYFGPIAEYNVFSHTWSLGVEEQFYVLFPFLFFSWTYLQRRRGVTVLFAALCTASLLYSAWSMQSNPIVAFYMLTSRFWELAAGGLLFQGMVHLGYFDKAQDAHKARSQWTFLGTSVSFLLLLYGFYSAKVGEIPFPGAIPTVCGTLGIIFFLFKQSDSNIFAKVLCSKPFLFCGKLSYSIYLWHWPVIVIFRWTIGIETIGHIILALGTTLFLSVFSFYCVEKPIRYSALVRKAPRFVVILTALSSVALFLCATNAVEKHKQKLSVHSATKNPSIWYPEHTGNTIPDYPERRLAITGNHVGAMWQSNYTLAGAAFPSSSPNLYVLGDSHAWHYSGMLKRYVLATGARVHIYHGLGASFLAFKWHSAEMDTEKFWTAASDVLKNITKGDVVFLPSFRTPRYCEQWMIMAKDEQSLIDIVTTPTSRNVRAGEEQLAHEFIRLVGEKGAHVLFEAPTPIFKAPAFRCYDWFNNMNPMCKQGLTYNKNALEALRRPVLDIYARLMKANPNVSVWDPFPALCPQGTEDCSALDANGLPLFFDGDHLSGHGNTVLYPPFIEAVQRTSPNN